MKNLRIIAGGALLGVICADLLARIATTATPDVVLIFDWWGAFGGAMATLPLLSWKRS